VSSRIRTPERDPVLEWEEPVRVRRRRPPAPPSARRVGLPLVGAALCIGLLVGWVASSGGGTTTVTETRTVTAPAAASAPAGSGAASRGEIALVVLNASGESGLAGRTADEARAMGYAQVTEGNAPSPENADRVLFRAGSAAQARQVAQDLGLPGPALIAPGDPVGAAADPEDQVIVVLGPSGAGGTAEDAGGAVDGAGAPAAGEPGGTVGSPQTVTPPAG
jgi:hypothetical protein